MTTKPNSHSNFRADSLAARVVVFFENNPDEELDLESITEKFDATRGNIHTLLAKAVELALLVRSTDKDGDYIYTAGKALTQAPRASEQVTYTTTAPATGKAAAKGYQSPRKTLDIAALVVEEGIPFAPRHNKGDHKWLPLFAKLTKAGQSVAIPGHMRGAIGAAAMKLSKSKTQGTYRVAKTGTDTARVWRVA